MTPGCTPRPRSPISRDGKCKYCKSPATKSILHSEGMAYAPDLRQALREGPQDAEACVPFGEPDPGNIDKVYYLPPRRSKESDAWERQIISARDQVAMLEPWLAHAQGSSLRRV